MSQELKEGIGEVWLCWEIRNNNRICTILPPRNIIWVSPRRRFPYSRQHKWWYRNCVEWGLTRAREPRSATTVYYIQQYLISYTIIKVLMFRWSDRKIRSQNVSLSLAQTCSIFYGDGTRRHWRYHKTSCISHSESTSGSFLYRWECLSHQYIQYFLSSLVATLATSNSTMTH